MPPPVATHVEQPAPISLAPRQRGFSAHGTAHLLNGRAWLQIRLFADVLVLCLASSAALFAGPIPGSTATRWLAGTFPLLTLAVLYARRNPDNRLRTSAFDTMAFVLGAVSLAAMMTIALGSIVGDAHPVGLAVRLWLFASVYLAVARVVLLSIRSQALRNDAVSTPTLIVGAGVVGSELVQRLMVDRRYGLRPVGFLDSDPLPTSELSSSLPVLGGPERLPEAVESTGARHVILAFSSGPDHVLVEQVKECERLGIGVSLVPRLFESISEHAVLDHVGGLPLLSLRPTDPRSWHFVVKHGLDRGIALVSLVALAPLIAAIALGVRLSSPGPVLFRQRRVGRDGRAFDLLKFRTMYEYDGVADFVLPDGCAPGGVEGADRRTALGRWLRGFSLDELPQLINVLWGEMSLVGPRPERPEYVARFAHEVNRYQDRHRVKSGITGWAQVNGLRGQTSIQDRVEWDNYYFQNWSLLFDLRIIAMTLGEMVRFRE
jgi:exopolysaccharide biosynthesis polyprenyl glycosylphosphotransferase